MRKSNGAATVATLVALAILLCLGAVLARLVKTEGDSTINFRDGIAAQCMAEAGLRRALVVLYRNGNPHGLTENVNRDSFAGSYQIATNMEGQALRVRSAGRVGNARRSSSVLVKVTVQSAPEEPMNSMTILSWNN